MRLLKIIFTLFLLILIPVNWNTYGPWNILWLSDITLLCAYFATIFESRFLTSMAALQGLVFEFSWVIAFIASIIFSWDPQLVGYMDSSSIPLWIRCLSLFHIILPFYIIWLLKRYGYTKKALPIQITITWIVSLLTWLFTNPAKNINFIFSYRKLGLNPLLYFLLFCIGASCVVYLTHLVIYKITRKKS